MLEAFEASDRSIFFVSDLKDHSLDYRTEKFVFHIAILADQSLISRDDSKPGFGFQRGADGHGAWSIIALRMTAAGHDFIEALRNKEVWATLKKDFKDASISTLRNVAPRLLEGYLKKKLDGLLG